MKQGRNIHDLNNEVMTVASLREDLIVPSPSLHMTDDLTLQVKTPDLEKMFGLTNVAHQGIARRLDIPKPYYDRMMVEAPALLAENVNTWMETEENSHMVRTLRQKDNDSLAICRALLSERYKRIDNDFVLDGLMPVLLKETDMIIESSEITETKFYLKCRFPSLERELVLHDAIQSGVVISNSEVGFGATNVSLLVYTVKCTNGMILPSKVFSKRKNHIGRVQQHDENFHIIASDKTKQLEDQAFLSTLADVIKAAADPDVWADLVDNLQKTTERKITGNVDHTVENVTQKMNLLQSEGESVMEYLARGGDLSQWGMASAVTRMAQDADSYDRSTELERVGGRIIELSTAEWERLAA
ncbi:MAG: hypothetical protein CMI54_02355 [Parcubacteria group bacterium]|nr:hypothetical protein [Parcubacteria group bacterium]